MAGYSRQRAAQIVNNSLADADDVAAELNQIQAAFNDTTGHRHDGTASEGPPIVVIGPSQDFVASLTDLSPKTTATYDLGTTSLEYKDGYFSGQVFADGFVGDITGDITGDVVGNVTGNLTGNVTGNVTGNLTGDVTGNVTGNLVGEITSSSVTVTGGTIDGTSIGTTTPSAGAFTTLSASADITGNLVGNVTGDLTGDVTGNLTGSVTGNVTGDLTGNVTGSLVGDVTGNADTATTLETSRTFTIGQTGKGFDGSVDVSWSSEEIGVVPQTSPTGAARLPRGTEAQRDGSPEAGDIRFNTDEDRFESFNGSSWSFVGTTVEEDVMLLSGANAMQDDLQMGDNKITDLADGTNPTDAATVGQLDAAYPPQIADPTDPDPEVSSLWSGQDFAAGLAAQVPGIIDEEFSVSGDAPKYANRMVLNFDGTTTPPTIRVGSNVSSVVRNSSGNFTVNLDTPMPSANYAVLLSVKLDGQNRIIHTEGLTASSFVIRVKTNSGSNDDNDEICAIIAG